MGRFTRQDVKEIERIDPETGEIKDIVREINSTSISRSFKEPNFIKVYYDTLLATIGENSSPLSEFLIAIGKHMVVEDDMQVVQLTKFTKNLIAKEIGKSPDRVKSYIAECVKLNLLYKVGTPRSAIYAVSPFIMSKSKPQDVVALQMNYVARQGVLEISKPDPKKKIEQLKFTGFEPQEADLEQK